jgi:hypothetical protein
MREEGLPGSGRFSSRVRQGARLAIVIEATKAPPDSAPTMSADRRPVVLAGIPDGDRYELSRLGRA